MPAAPTITSIDALPALMKLHEVLALARRCESWWYKHKALEKRIGLRVLPTPNQLGLYSKREVLKWLDLR